MLNLCWNVLKKSVGLASGVCVLLWYCSVLGSRSHECGSRGLGIQVGFGKELTPGARYLYSRLVVRNTRFALSIESVIVPFLLLHLPHQKPNNKSGQHSDAKAGLRYWGWDCTLFQRRLCALTLLNHSVFCVLRTSDYSQTLNRWMESTP